MIAVHELRVRHAGASTDTLQDVSLRAEDGALTAIVGPNGSGKSTLVRAIMGRLAAAQGHIVVDGAAPSPAGAALARRLAVVAQREEPAFPLPVRDYVALGRHPWRAAWAAESPRDADAIARALAVADVARLAGRRTDALSGGEWQRVRLARALAQETPALLLDEPTTFLDVAHEMAAFELFAALARSGRCVVVVSHQLNLVTRFAQHVVLLHRGRIAAAGPPEAVMRGEVLEHVYEWPLVVSRDPAVGAPTLVPLRRPRPPLAP